MPYSSIKKLITGCILIIFLSISPFQSSSAQFSWHRYANVKVTMETEREIYEWEYENPESFEYEKGDRIVRGEEAKRSFEHMLNRFDLTKNGITDEEIEKLEKVYRENIVRFVIERYDRNFQHEVFIWLRKT